MALYKGVQIDDDLPRLIGNMHQVEEYRENLQTLQAVWDNLTLLGHLSGTGADMSETRAAFHSLTGSLLNHLGRETLKKSVLEMNSKAQVAVNIMVRNLFERTADIGFLAMDGEIREYLLQAGALGAAPDTAGGMLQSNEESAAWHALAQRRAALHARFGEYVRKYSVYSNIILLDPAGNILLQLDESNGLRHSGDLLVAESLQSRAPYVETFRHTELHPGEPRALIYSSRVTDGRSDQPLGVLCLCFRFADETEKIFAKLMDAQDWSVLSLLDEEGRVIASSDPHHIAPGSVQQRVLDADWQIVRFAGRQYLATTRATQGYQGYGGPGWYGHVMLPIEHAFDHEGSAVAEMSETVQAAVTSNQRLFGSELREIPLQARRIQRALNRSVWNGSVRQNGEAASSDSGFAKVLLWEISNTGFKTQDVFERSIGNLHQTVVSSLLQDNGFRAALAIDIMDRNLYERANDCRWWALAPVFRRVLAGTPDEAGVREVRETLAHINSLYTVYENLALFDRDGRVLAVSNPRYENCVGEVIGEEWLPRSLKLADAQSYVVSPFEATPLYDGRHTYVYAAAVFAPQGGREAVGGIGIVFDAQAQFHAMLEDALPRDDKGRVPEGCFGVFADRQGRVVASTHAGFAPGANIELDGKYFSVANAAVQAGIAEFSGAYYAVGACMSSGYREFKGHGDPYRNDVVALIFVPLGEKRVAHGLARAHARGHGRSHGRGGGVHAGQGSEHMEIATFYVGGHWVGIGAEFVVEATDPRDMTRASSAEGAGYMMFRGEPVPVLGLENALGAGASASPVQERQIVILQLSSHLQVGVLVDELGDIQAVSRDQIEQVSGILGGAACVTDGLVRPDDGGERPGMLMLLSPQRLGERLFAAH